MTGLVYKEPVVLCRLGSGTWKIGLKQVNKGEITTIKRLGRWLFTPVKGECSRHQLRRCFKCNLTKWTTKSSADWQCSYLLRAAVVNAAWSWGHAHVILQSHGFTGKRSCMFSCAALPSWLAPPLPSLFFPLFLSVRGAWTPGKGSLGWVAGIASHTSATWSSWLAGFPWKPLDISGNQLPFCDLVGDCGNLTLNNFLI